MTWNFTSIRECPVRAVQPPVSIGTANGHLAACEPQLLTETVIEKPELNK